MPSEAKDGFQMPQWSEDHMRELAKAEEGFLGAGDTPYNRAVHAIATATPTPSERKFDVELPPAQRYPDGDHGTWKLHAPADLLALRTQYQDIVDGERVSKDTAYSERDRLVCAISKVFPSWLERHPDSDTTWDDDWRWIVFVQFPTGQASWHIHDSERDWFAHLAVQSGNSWDGHSTAEKYARIERFERIGLLKP